MALSGVGGVPEPQKPQQSAAGNQSEENDAVSIFNSLDRNNDGVLDTEDNLDKPLLDKLKELVKKGKLTLENIRKNNKTDALLSLTYTKTEGNDNILYNIQGQAIGTCNSYDDQGNLKSNKIEEYIFVKDADGNDFKVKVNIDKNACANKKTFVYIMQQLASEINTLKPEARTDLANEVDGIKVEFEANWNTPAGRFVEGENVIELIVHGNGNSLQPYIMPNTIAHELGHAIDEHKGKFRLSQQINTVEIRKSLYSKVDFGKYSDEQRYFLFGGADELPAEYYAYKYGGNPNADRYALMREVEKSDVKFKEAAKACEQIWDNSRKNVEQQKIEKNLYKIEKLQKLKGDAVSQYRNDFYAISEILDPDADEFLTNTQILQQYYRYKTGDCDEATAEKFKSMEESENASFKKLEPMFLKELKRLGIEV